MRKAKARPTRARNPVKGKTPTNRGSIRTTVSSRPISNGHLITTDKINAKTCETLSSVEKFSKTKPRIIVK